MATKASVKLEGARESAYLRQVSFSHVLGKFVGVMSGLSLGTRVSNLKSVALTVLKLLAFNAQKFRGSRDRGHAPFWENFRGSCPDCPW